jgi:hypothetical protein
LTSSRRVKKGPGRRPQSAKRQRFMELRARGWSVRAAAREVAERITRDPGRLFGSVRSGVNRDLAGFDQHEQIRSFIGWVNDHSPHNGLEPIPATALAPHMFRRTMAVITANEPDGEIALGITLKHNATRALANATTSGYAAPTPEWAKEFEHHAKEAAAGELVADWARHVEGERGARGPGAGTFVNGLANVTDNANTAAAVGSERMLRNLLRDEFATIRLGTLNHCLGDPSKALCLEGRIHRGQSGWPHPEHVPTRHLPKFSRHRQAPPYLEAGGNRSCRETEGQEDGSRPPPAPRNATRRRPSNHRARAQMTTVSPTTEKKLRDAMQRLLEGQSKRTDGRLTKANLHVEAGVSRATMNRAAAVVAEWNTAVGAQVAPRDSQIVELQETVSKLKRTIATLRQRNSDLERKNRAAVTVIAEFHAQLRASQGDEPTGTVTPLPDRPKRRRW